MPSSLSEATYLLPRLAIQAIRLPHKGGPQRARRTSITGEPDTNSLVEPVKDENVCRDLIQLSIVQRRAR